MMERDSEYRRSNSQSQSQEYRINFLTERRQYLTKVARIALSMANS